jgi:hypothetical protein
MNLFSEHLNSLVRNHPDNLSCIAQNSHLSRPSLYDLINGKTLPKESTLENLCSALSLSENSTKNLFNLDKSERLRSSRKELKYYLQQKKVLISEVSSLLLAKGHEISRPISAGKADLVLRLNSQRIPVLICPPPLDYPRILGSLLISMFHFSSDKGYLCTPNVKSLERKTIQLFNSHGILILSIKGILKELKSFR